MLRTIEHVRANHRERHTDEFAHPSDSKEYRNRIGRLVLLPKSFNATYVDLPYAESATITQASSVARIVRGGEFLTTGSRLETDTGGAPGAPASAFTRFELMCDSPAPWVPRSEGDDRPAVILRRRWSPVRFWESPRLPRKVSGRG